MDDKNILNNLSTLSDNDYLYFCNDMCESYANNTYERNSIHYNISHNKNLYDKIINYLCNPSKIVQLSSTWCTLVILLTLEDNEVEYKIFIDCLFEMNINVLLSSYYFLKLRQQRRFECKHPILGKYYIPSDKLFSYYLFKLNELYIKISQNSINSLFSLNSLRVFYNLIKTEEYKLNKEYEKTYSKILNMMINNLQLYNNSNNYKYISTKLIKCYYNIITDYYSNSNITYIPINIINDIITALKISLFIDKSSQLYYYVVYYYTLLIITSNDEDKNEENENLLFKIFDLFPLNDEMSFLQLILYLYINNDQLMYDILYIDLIFYMKFNDIFDKEIMNNFNPIIIFNLYLAIFEYEVDDIFQIINSENSQIFLLFLLKFLKWTYSNKQMLIQSDICLLYYRIMACLSELSIKFDLKNNGFRILDKWIKNNL